MTRWFLDLWAGLTAGTTASWIGAVVFCALEFVAAAVVFQPRRLVKFNPHYLMQDRGDEYCLLSWRLMKMRYSTLERLQVVYMGASQATRSLHTIDPAILSAEVSEAAGMDIDFNVFSSNNQRFEEALEITDQFPASYRGVVVMIVNDYKDDYKGKGGRDPVAQKRLRRRIATVGVPSLQGIWAASGYKPLKTGNFFLDHLDFFAARRGAAMRLTPPKGLPGQGSFNHEKLEEALDRLGKQHEEIDNGDDQLWKKLDARAPLLTKSRRVTTRLLSNMNRRGVTVVFVANPELPSRDRVYAERVERFHAQIDELAASYGGVYWDFNPDLGLEDSDFQDMIHLGNDEARRRFQTLLMDHLGELFRERFDPAGGAGGASAGGLKRN